MIDVERTVTPDEAETPIRRIAFDRPAARNALTPSGLETLFDAVVDADEPVIVLEGRGDAFCAGADLDVVSRLDRDGGRELAELGQRVARAIEACEATVVAAIDGPAMGGGLELALACDLRVATPRSTFGEPGVTFGLFGAWGGTVRLPRIVGEGPALDLALTGRTIDAETALEMGLIGRIATEPDEVVAELAANPPETLSVLCERIRDGDDAASQEEREAEAFADLVETHREALRALRE
ncbi:enoyl-CoA hydratase/isomerase family protein [Halovivax gelatinilyticus]|uniref:enoyl-CoA hydratase/isomerase family protein n=1 Tax=Halovivax gelatinilyticus TaxID=2961597 RepID=UPI0020CA5BAC|nr:enoyl-CoA hydratase/isomerase family protein [Halovivax gelatinilyticus]